MPINWKAHGRLDKLQALLDQGKTPGECAKFFQQEFGLRVRPAAIRHTITRHGLRFQPKPAAKPPKSGKQVKRMLAEEPTEPVKLDVDYAEHDEDPGDDKEPRYRWKPTAESMPRRGEY